MMGPAAHKIDQFTVKRPCLMNGIEFAGFCCGQMGQFHCYDTKAAFKDLVDDGGAECPLEKASGLIMVIVRLLIFSFLLGGKCRDNVWDLGFNSAPLPSILDRRGGPSEGRWRLAFCRRCA